MATKTKDIPLTPEQVKFYIKHKGQYCPHCQKQPDGLHTELDRTDGMVAEEYCPLCNHRFELTYVSKVVKLSNEVSHLYHNKDNCPKCDNDETDFYESDYKFPSGKMMLVTEHNCEDEDCGKVWKNSWILESIVDKGI